MLKSPTEVTLVPHVRAAERHRQLVLAARVVLCRDGVAGTTLRAVAAQAGVPLGTLQYVFPAKANLLLAVIEDTIAEVSSVLEAVDARAGLEQAIREGLEKYWSELVVDDPALALMRHELYLHALRTPDLQDLARRQIEGYTRIVTGWARRAATTVGDECAVSYETLADTMVASMMGLTLSYLSHRDRQRSRRDLETMISMLVGLAVRRT